MTTGSVATGNVVTGSVATGNVVTGSVAKGSAPTSSSLTASGAPADAGHRADADARDGSKQLRDIEELVAKLAFVTRQLALPSPRYADALAPDPRPAASDL